MKRQQLLKQRIQTLTALRDAVGAMRSLAAHHFRRARQALAAARRYRGEMDMIIAQIGIHQPLHAGLPAGLLVVASDLGLCGDYNTRLAHRAITEAQEHHVRHLYSVGRRVRGSLARHKLTPDRSYEAPASFEGVSRLLLGLAQDLLDDYLEKRIGSLQVVSASFDGVGHFTPVTVRLLPIEPVAADRELRRSSYNDSNHLTIVAVREFVYITLYEILLDSLAAEHGMRLMAAESALDWLDNTATMTSRRLASARSEASTQELLDIISGSRQRLHAESR
jgi:F-type H+-transporting ATPase subunit gamma